MSRSPLSAVVVAVPVDEDAAESKARGLRNVPRFDGTRQHIEEAPRAGSKRRGGAEVFEASAVYSPPDEAAATAFLSQKHWPQGLISILLKSCEKYPIRHFIIDDSGSMSTNDGHKVIGAADDPKKQRVIKCTRWSELRDCLEFHAELSHAAKAPTVFRFLNMSEPLSVGFRHDVDGAGLRQFLQLLEDDGPGGQTPLCEQVRQVIASIRESETELRRAGQRACVIIATDGEATDGDLAEAMRPFQDLPVWLVVRVCTDDEATLRYWNSIDTELEIEMDVLDDLSGEAREIKEANGWVTYHEALHRLREFGSSLKELDLIDEAALSSEQMCIVASALVVPAGHPRLPLPDNDFDAFLAAVKMHNTRLVFDPILRSPAPILNVPKLIAKFNRSPLISSKSCVIG